MAQKSRGKTANENEGRRAKKVSTTSLMMSVSKRLIGLGLDFLQKVHNILF